MAFRGALLLIVLSGWAGVASGQITVQPVQLSGTVSQIGPQSIAMKAANGQDWLLDLRQGNPKITVSGTAEREMLTPGTCVRFTASIDKRTCKATEKIDKVIIFTQTPGVPERMLGVDLTAGRRQVDANAAGAAGSPQGPPAGQVANDFSSTVEGEDGAQGPKRRGGGSKGPDKSVPDVATYEVCAEVANYRAGRLVVTVKNRFLRSKITAELTPDVKVGLDLGKEWLAKVSPGEKISVAGFFAVPGNCPLVQKVEIALAEPLSPPGSRRRRSRVAAHPATTAQKPEAKTKVVRTTAGEKPSGEAAPSDEKSAPLSGADAKAPAKPDSKTAPAAPGPKDDAPQAAPESKPETKKPEKEPPLKDDEKDVFEK